MLTLRSLVLEQLILGTARSSILHVALCILATSIAIEFFTWAFLLSRRHASMATFRYFRVAVLPI